MIRSASPGLKTRSQIDGVLKSALGLGGRSGKAGSVAEQARVNVTKNIGRALDQIEAKHESLGRLLKSTIKTGTFCSYQLQDNKLFAQSSVARL